MTKVLVTGATGNVGQHVVRYLLERGIDVVAAAGLNFLDKSTWPDALGGATRMFLIEGADAVLSTLGARSNTPDQIEIFGRAMENITTAMKEHGVQRPPSQGRVC